MPHTAHTQKYEHEAEEEDPVGMFGGRSRQPLDRPDLQMTSSIPATMFLSLFSGAISCSRRDASRGTPGFPRALLPNRHEPSTNPAGGRSSCSTRNPSSN